MKELLLAKKELLLKALNAFDILEDGVNPYKEIERYIFEPLVIDVEGYVSEEQVIVFTLIDKNGKKIERKRGFNILLLDMLSIIYIENQN
jgi:hypothetical protein